jgi:hypothetical protein
MAGKLIWLLAAGCWLLAAGYWLLASNNNNSMHVHIKPDQL